MQYTVKTESKVKGAYEQQVKGTKFLVLVVQNLDVNDGIIIQNKEVKKNSTCLAKLSLKVTVVRFRARRKCKTLKSVSSHLGNLHATRPKTSI